MLRRGDRGRGSVAASFPRARPGKLPPETVSARYAARVRRERARGRTPTPSPDGARVVIHDDVLATGGTVAGDRGPRRAARRPVVVGINFVIELSFLEGRKRLGGYDIYSLIEY